MAVVCAVLAYPTQCVWPMPSAPSAYRESTAVMSCTVSCQCVVCGWCMSVCGVRVVGYPLSAPPLFVVVGVAIVDGGVALRGGVAW